MSARRRRLRTPPDGALTGDQRRFRAALLDSPRASSSRSHPLVDQDGNLAGPFGPLLLAPLVGDAVQALGTRLRFEGALRDDLRELAVLEVARRWACEYEWSVHRDAAVRAGLTEGQLEAVAAGRPAVGLFDDDQTLVRQVASALVKRRRLPDDVFDAASDRLGQAVLVELCCLVGYYALLAGVLVTFDVS